MTAIHVAPGHGPVVDPLLAIAGSGPHELLRFATAGSVDDGKSTLVGRLLHDTKSVLADTLAAVERASVAKGHDGADLALLTDGLRAEREQGITIDVAHRYFSTATRSYVLADTPGHVEYTRNMVTGASTAELALVLVDARHGVVEQTRRHAAAAALLGVRHLALAVNKMDLVGFDQAVFTTIRDDFASVAARLGVDDVVAIPLSALAGDNVVDRSDRTPWYSGPTLLEHLEAVPVGQDPSLEPFRFPVQYVIRPQTDEHPDHRGYAGRVAHGVVRVGDAVVVLPSGRTTSVAGIDGLDGSLQEAFAPQSVSIRLADDVDVSRGDLIAASAEAATPSQDLEGDVCVVSDRAIAAGDRVLVRHGTRTVRAKVVAVSSRLDLVSLESSAYTGGLVVNDIGRLTLRLAEPVAADDYSRLRRTGAFLLVDEQDGSPRAGAAPGVTCSSPSRTAPPSRPAWPSSRDVARADPPGDRSDRTRTTLCPLPESRTTAMTSTITTGSRLRRGAAVAAAALLAVTGLAACGTSEAAAPAASSGAAAAEAQTLRLGYFANITHALPLIGVQDGTYAKTLGSTKLETQIFNAGPAAVEALFAGSLDAAYVGPNPAINAFTKSNGEAVRIVAGASSGGAQLVVLPTITDAQGLKGQTVASPQLGGTQDVALRYWLGQQGLSAPVTGTGDVTVAPQENSQTLDLFKAGKIAGAWVPEPWASRLVTEGGGKVLVDEKTLWPQGAFVTTHLIVSTDFLAKYPGTVTKLLEAEAATLDAVKADPTKAKTTANEALKALTGKNLKPAVLDRAFDNLTLTLDPIASTLQVSADHGVEVGTTKKADLSGIYDLSLLNALLKVRGEQPVSAAGLGKE